MRPCNCGTLKPCNLHSNLRWEPTMLDFFNLFNFWPPCTHCGIHHPPAIPCEKVTLPWDW
jgi:hypothetical protein